MTKKHYEAIAKIVRGAIVCNWQHPESYGKALADYFATDNPKFDRERFLAACGIDVSQT